MKAAGLKAFSEGANGQIEAPQAPTIFNWSDPRSGESIITMLHPRGYGMESHTNSALWDDDALGLGTVDLCPNASDTVSVTGFSEALVYAFKGDNQGPHFPEEVHTALGCVQKMFPGAEVAWSKASHDLDAVLVLGVWLDLRCLHRQIG